MGATLAHILLIGMENSEDALTQSGSYFRVRDARAERGKLARKAAKLLQSLEVRPEDVEHLIDDCIRKRLGRAEKAS
jgi:hypothetical protein